MIAALAIAFYIRGEDIEMNDNTAYSTHVTDQPALTDESQYEDLNSLQL